MPVAINGFHTFALTAEPGRESEDAIAIGEGVAVVVDGAGLPKSMREGCRHSVSWYARTLAEALREWLEDRANSMQDALAAAIAGVAGAHARSCDLTAGSPSATVAAWRVDGANLDYLVLCDASVVLIGADGRVCEVTDGRIDAAVDRAAAEDLAGRRVDRAEESRVRFAALERVRNTPDGFWCCHVDPAAAYQSMIGRVPLAKLRGVVISSDGGTRGFHTFGAHTIDRFAALALGGELGQVASEIRSAERSAPQDLKVKRHDDIALVAATFSPGGHAEDASQTL